MLSEESAKRNFSYKIKFSHGDVGNCLIQFVVPHDVFITIRLTVFKSINTPAAWRIPQYGISTTLVKSVPQAAPARSAENVRVNAEVLFPFK